MKLSWHFHAVNGINYRSSGEATLQQKIKIVTKKQRLFSTHKSGAPTPLGARRPYNFQRSTPSPTVFRFKITNPVSKEINWITAAPVAKSPVQQYIELFEEKSLNSVDTHALVTKFRKQRVPIELENEGKLLRVLLQLREYHTARDRLELIMATVGKLNPKGVDHITNALFHIVIAWRYYDVDTPFPVVYDALRKVVNLFHSSIADGGTVSEKEHSLILKTYEAVGDNEGFENYFDLLVKSGNMLQNPESIKSLFSHFGRIGNLKQLENLMKMLGGPDFNSYYLNIYLDCFTANHGISRMTELLEKISAFSFDLVTYNILLSAFGSAGSIAQMEAIFEMITQREKLEPDEYSFIERVRAYSRIGDLRGVEHVLKEMEQKYKKFYMKVYSIAIRAYGEIGNLQSMESIRIKLIELNNQLDLPAYLALLRAYGKAGRLSKVNALYEEMKKLNLENEPQVFLVMLEIYANASKLTEWTQFLRQFDASHSLTLRDYEVILSTAAKLSRLTTMHTFHNRMRQQGIEVSAKICNIFIGYAETHNLPQTKTWWKSTRAAIRLSQSPQQDEESLD